MKKIAKKIISVILAITIALTTVLATVAASDECPLDIEITTNKDEYGTLGKAKFVVEVTNKSNATVENVSAEAVFDELDPFGFGSEISAEDSALEPGETLRFEFKATLDAEVMELNFFQRVILKIKRFFHGDICGFADEDFNDGRAMTSKVHTVTFGDYEVEQLVEVWYDSVDEEAAISIDREVFKYDDDNSTYYIGADVEEIKGSLSNKSKAKKLSYFITDNMMNQVDAGNIDIDDNWSFSDFGLVMGDNKLSVTVEYDDGTTYTDEISFVCYTDTYLENVEIDIETDTDSDGISDYLEEVAGSDKNSNDTDGDGLTDYQEEVILLYESSKKDTDNDGTIDYNEDYDGDTIVDGEEFKLGTDPLNDDSDFDDLFDSDEINVYNTDPLDEDTDDDGANDGAEVRLGTNPLVADTFFKDSETYGAVSDNLPISAEVEVVVVKGNQVGTIEIERITVADNYLISPMIPGYLGSAYDFSVDGAFESATITFKYDKDLGLIGEDFQPRIYYLNENTGELEELPNQKVENGKVSVDVEHFSTYILLNKVEFDKVWEAEIAPPLSSGENNENDALDIVFVIDYSHSMSWNDPDGLRKQVTKDFISKLRDGKDKAAVVSFIKEPSVLCNLTDNKYQLYSAVDGIVDNNGYGTNAGTNGSNAINTALNILNSSSANNKFIVFLTDGEDTYTSYSYSSLTSKAIENNITIYSIGLGTADESLLKSIAEPTNGKYYKASTNIDLTEIYDKIEEETIDLTTDKNEDLIPDYYNDLIFSGELVLSNGSSEFKGIDFNYAFQGVFSDDYDNDGLKNGEELIVSYNENTGRISMKMVSNPTLCDSDYDNISDRAEIKAGSDPWKQTYSASLANELNHDYKYAYIELTDIENKWYNKADRINWKAITFDWSPKKEIKDEITYLLGEYNTPENFAKLQEEEKRSILAQLLNSLYAFFIENLDKKAQLGLDVYGECDTLFKDLFKLCKTEKKVSIDTFKKIKDATLDFAKQKKIDFQKFEFKIESKSVKIGSIFFFLEEIGDVYNQFDSWSKIEEALDVYEDNIDALKKMTTCKNSFEEKDYIKNAAKDLVKYFEEKKVRFLDKVEDITLLTVENLASLGFGLLMGSNPITAAVAILIAAADFILPFSAKADDSFRMFALRCVSDETKYIIEFDFHGDYCDIAYDSPSYLMLLLSTRLLGEDHAIHYIDKQNIHGMNKNEEKAWMDEIDDFQNDLLDLWNVSVPIKDYIY